MLALAEAGADPLAAADGAALAAWDGAALGAVLAVLLLQAAKATAAAKTSAPRRLGLAMVTRGFLQVAASWGAVGCGNVRSRVIRLVRSVGAINGSCLSG